MMRTKRRRRRRRGSILEWEGGGRKEGRKEATGPLSLFLCVLLAASVDDARIRSSSDDGGGRGGRGGKTSDINASGVVDGNRSLTSEVVDAVIISAIVPAATMRVSMYKERVTRREGCVETAKRSLSQNGEKIWEKNHKKVKWLWSQK